MQKVMRALDRSRCFWRELSQSAAMHQAMEVDLDHFRLRNNRADYRARLGISQDKIPSRFTEPVEPGAEVTHPQRRRVQGKLRVMGSSRSH
jgi:hypothetical protein